MNNALTHHQVSVPIQNLTEQDLAKRWKISVKTLQDWRLRGNGPVFLKLGKSVRYPLEEILAYEEKNRATSTSVGG